PAEVIRDPARARALRERLELLQVAAVERVGASHRERDAVQRHREALDDLVEHEERPAARVHEVLGKHLEPVERGLARQDLSEVYGAQPDAGSEVGQAEAIHLPKSTTGPRSSLSAVP